MSDPASELDPDLWRRVMAVEPASAVPDWLNGDLHTAASNTSHPIETLRRWYAEMKAATARLKPMIGAAARADLQRPRGDGKSVERVSAIVCLRHVERRQGAARDILTPPRMGRRR